MKKFFVKGLVGLGIFCAGYWFLFIRSGFSPFLCLVGSGNFITGEEHCVGLLAPFSPIIQTVAFFILLFYSIYITITFDKN